MGYQGMLLLPGADLTKKKAWESVDNLLPEDI